MRVCAGERERERERDVYKYTHVIYLYGFRDAGMHIARCIQCACIIASRQSYADLNANAHKQYQPVPALLWMA